MRKFYFFLVLSFISLDLLAQPWMQAPFMQINSPADSAKLYNFYEIQKAFQKYEQTFDSLHSNSIIENDDDKDEAEKEEEGKFPGWAQFKRWEWRMEPRVFPTGNITIPARKYEEFQKYLNSKSVSSSKNQTLSNNNDNKITANYSGNWTALGPTGNHMGGEFFGGSGRVNFIKFDPNNSNIMWTGAPTGGLWKTTDGGQNWTTNTDQLTIIGCSDLAINPKNTNIMYLATGDGDGTGSQLNIPSIGVLKSTDGGSSWGGNTMNWQLGWARNIYKLLINPIHPDTVFAASNAGLYRTINGGNSWSIVQSGQFTHVVYKPGNYSVVYAASGVSSNGVFYKSTDGGATFAAITSGLPSSTLSARMKIGVSAADTNLVYVIVVKKTTADFEGFYASTDGGNNFSLRSNTPNILAGISGSQAWYNLCMAVSPFKKDTIIVGATDSYRSTDGGVTWTKHTSNGIGGPLVHPDHHAYEYLPGSESTYFSGNDGGVWKTTDYGVNWTPMNEGLQISEIYKIGVSKLNPNTFMTGHQDMGSHQYKNSNWSIFTPNTGDGMENIYEMTNDTVIYMESYNGRILKAYNTYPLFNVICSSTGSGVNAASSWITPIVMHPTIDSILLVGKQQVWKTTNRGTSFTQLGSISGGSTYLIALAYAPSNPNYIYAAKSNKVFVSEDGATFTDRTAGLPTSSVSITSVVVSNTNPKNVWVTFSGYSSTDKVWKSTDAGVTWSNYSTGLPNLPANCLAYENNTNNILYLGMDVGVYTISDTLTSWQAFYTGLPNVDVQEMEISPSINKIRAATNGRGVWESDLRPQGTVSLTLSASSLTISAPTNSKKAFDITSNTSWTISSNQNWITADKVTGSNNSNIILTALENIVTTPRSAIITITGTGVATKTINVTQDAAAPILTLSNNSLTISAPANSKKTVELTSNTSWNLNSNQSWLQTNANIGQGSNTITLTADENLLITPRSATITGSAIGVPNAILYVEQEGAEAYLTLSTKTITLQAPANSSGSFNITSNTSWTVTNIPTWLKSSNTLGSGTLTVTINADENKDNSPRFSDLIIIGEKVNPQTFTVIQLSKAPFLSIYTFSNTFESESSNTNTLVILSNTSWTASSNQSWLTFSKTIGSNNESIKLNVTENSSTNTRSATISVTNSIESKLLLVTQKGNSIIDFVDLEVVSLHEPFTNDSLIAGKLYNMDVTIRNNGTKPLNKISIFAVIKNCDSTYYSSDYGAIVNQLNPGNSFKSTLVSFTIPKPGNYYLTVYPNTDVDGNRTNDTLKSKCLKVVLPTSIDNQTIKELSIYPNPNDGEFTVASDEPIENIRITDILGRVVFEDRIDSKHINLKQQTAGVYLVTITRSGITTTMKLIINGL